MRKQVASIAVLAAVLAPVVAQACMADGPEGYVSGLIWENRHTRVPDDAMILKVQVVQPNKEIPMALIVNVIEGPTDLVGRSVNLVPAEMHSCVGLGRLSGFVAVRKSTKSFDGVPDQVFYQAIDYLPDPLDRSKGFKRKNNWFIPGEPAPPMRKPWEE